jgi:hypothetical protein
MRDDFPLCVLNPEQQLRNRRLPCVSYVVVVLNPLGGRAAGTAARNDGGVAAAPRGGFAFFAALSPISSFLCALLASIRSSRQ